MINGVCDKEIFKNHRFHRVEIIIEEGKEAGTTKNKGKRRQKKERKCKKDTFYLQKFGEKFKFM